MSLILLVVLIVLVPIVQVVVPPLFPVAGANADIALVVLALLVVFADHRVFMVALPVMTLLLGFATGHAPALLLVAYLPLLPFAAYLADRRSPLVSYAQLLIAGVSTGLFARLLLSLVAFAQGADLQLSYALGQVLVPGAFIDATLLTILYFPLRFVGWTPQPTALRRGGFTHVR